MPEQHPQADAWPSELFAARVAAARRQQRVTQQDLADAVGLTRTSISNVEAGRQHVNLDRAERIAFALGYPLWRMIHPDPLVTIHEHTI